MIKISFEKKKQKKGTFTEFSKKALAAMIAIWFIGALFGLFVVSLQLYRHEMVSLSDVLMYIGAPMTGGIIAYMIKSAQENKEKIKKGTSESEGNI